MHLMSISFVNLFLTCDQASLFFFVAAKNKVTPDRRLIYFSLEVFVQKNANFSPKALTKERSIPSSKYCIYLVCGLQIKPKFKAFLPSLVRVC